MLSSLSHSLSLFTIHTFNNTQPQARESAGGDELDDLVSAPRMVLQQYVDKWFPEEPEELARMSERSLKKLLLDVSTLLVVCLCV